MQEIELHPIIKDWLSKSGYVCYSEVPMLSRFIDVIGIHQTNKTIIAIELKLFAWKKAMSQAIVYRIVADYSYIGMPANAICNVKTEKFKKFGIGIIEIGNDIEIKLKAIKSNKVHESIRREMLQTIECFQLNKNLSG